MNIGTCFEIQTDFEFLLIKKLHFESLKKGKSIIEIIASHLKAGLQPICQVQSDPNIGKCFVTCVANTDISNFDVTIKLHIKILNWGNRGGRPSLKSYSYINSK